MMTTDPRAFLLTRILLWGLAEILCSIGNTLPPALASTVWRWALALNPHHEVAAGNRARILFDRGHPEAWNAFETVLRQLANPGDTSASDLHLSRTPGRLLRRLAARGLWGPSAAPIESQHDASLQQTCSYLARGFFDRWLVTSDFARAAQALEIWRSIAGEGPEVGWAEADLAWCAAEGGATDWIEEAAGLIETGSFVSPLDTLTWAQRCFEAGRFGLAERCLELARSWIPEVPGLWRLDGELARVEGDIRRCRESWERCLALDPQDVQTFLRVQVPEGTSPATRGTLRLHAPTTIPLGQTGTVTATVEDTEPHGWSLYLLPPAGWGLIMSAEKRRFDDRGSCELEVRANRGDRVRGGAWPLVAVALDEEGHTLTTRCQISVRDNSPGQVLLAITEDHEIHEERGVLDPQMLHRLLVEKSRFATDLGFPWTHMVEAGSTLAMLDWAAEQGGPWPALRTAVRRHLAEEVNRGNDLQPHLHTFNDPAYSHFPYRVTPQGWVPALGFLLTGASRRGDWASVCPPPGRSEARPGLDRLASITRAVAQIEQVGRLGDPDHRPVLWRSGLLEYGEQSADRAWSTVALRRAGLLADSDRNKPGSPLVGAVGPAFFAAWGKPFEPLPGGPLLQLPIVANLEGDYLMGHWLLERRARRSVGAVSSAGQPDPGVHLFTLLTHDKFINARRGRQEFRLDPEYGDWRTVGNHLEAWQKAGAQLVTARQGIEAVIDDLTWAPVPWLDQETFVASSKGSTPEVRYRLRVLGRGIPVSPDQPQHLLIPVPCSLRPLVKGVAVSTTEALSTETPIADPETGTDGGAFWWRRTEDGPATVAFRLGKSLGPRLLRLHEDPRSDVWRATFTADEPFLSARVLLPWTLGLAADRRYHLLGSAEPQPEIRHLEEGLLLTGLCFPCHDDNRDGGPEPLEILLTVDSEPTRSREEIH